MPSLLQVLNLPSPHGACISEWDYNYFTESKYSDTKCTMDKKSKFISQKCGCKDFYMPSTNTKRFCSLDDYFECMKSAESELSRQTDSSGGSSFPFRIMKFNDLK